eukprot:2443622-Rhodomonas_salina.1
MQQSVCALTSASVQSELVIFPSTGVSRTCLLWKSCMNHARVQCNKVRTPASSSCGSCELVVCR